MKWSTDKIEKSQWRAAESRLNNKKQQIVVKRFSLKIKFHQREHLIFKELQPKTQQ